MSSKQTEHTFQKERILDSVMDHLREDTLVTDVHQIPDTDSVAVTLATGDRYTVGIDTLWRAYSAPPLKTAL